jgi:ketosteroid isomerase-like protein
LGEKAEYIRGFVEAWNAGELDALIENANPEIEWVVAREHPAATTHHGIEAVAAYLRDWFETVPDLRIEIEELEEAGDRVLVLMRMTGRGSGSGALTEVRIAAVSTFHDGKPVRTEEYLDLDEARQALAAA